MSVQWKNMVLPILAFGVLAATAASEVASLPDVKEKKLIRFGWARVTPGFLSQNLTMIETETPYDGMGVELTGKTVMNGKTVPLSSLYLMSALPWKYEDFREDIELLKNLRPTRLKHNFLHVSRHRSKSALFDDNAWRITCNNFRILAKIAKETGCAGIAFDLENYPDAGNGFCYNPKDGKSFSEAWNKARQRGREFIQAVTSEYPDITIFTFFWSSLLGSSIDDTNNVYRMGKTLQNGLFPGFLNGVYDAIPPDVKIVDGNEGLGYKSDSWEKFQMTTSITQRNFLKMLAPDNRAKALGQTQMGMAVYLHAFFPVGKAVNGSWDLCKGMNNRARLKKLRSALYYALKASDEYVWTWEEHISWWPVAGKNFSVFSQMVPGVNEVFRSVKNASEAGLAVKANRSPNLLEHGDFELHTGKVTTLPMPDYQGGDIGGWSIWNPKREKTAAFRFAPGKGRNQTQAGAVSGFSSGGAVIASLGVEPGGMYLFRGYVRSEQLGAGTVAIYWKKDLKSPWIWDRFSEPIVTAGPETGKDSSGWSLLEVHFMVPESVKALGIVLNIAGQRPDTDTIYFDDLALYQIKLPKSANTNQAK